ncbi:MAG: LytTR family transcriptional regulator [Peptostreptococcaceae bacterium]|nr:LytTR family transcriptional regulator [Peptostreptococcaceae bacterium]
MEIEISVDKNYVIPKIIIKTSSMNEEVQKIVSMLSKDEIKVISGMKEDKVEILDENNISRVYAQNGMVYASTQNGVYVLKLRLYEIEEILNNKKFVRISKSEIINLREVKNFDFSFVGTISVQMKNNDVCYVSRRFVSKIKKILGI